MISDTDLGRAVRSLLNEIYSGQSVSVCEAEQTGKPTVYICVFNALLGKQLKDHLIRAFGEPQTRTLYDDRGLSCQ